MPIGRSIQNIWRRWGQARGRSPHYAGGRCRQAISRFFTVAVNWNVCEWPLESGGRCMQEVTEAGFSVLCEPNVLFDSLGSACPLRGNYRRALFFSRAINFTAPYFAKLNFAKGFIGLCHAYIINNHSSCIA